MSSRLTLSIADMQEDFFTDTALIGIASSLPAYRLCGVLNKCFDVQLTREVDMDVPLRTKQQSEHHFSIYQYCAPLNGARYLLYKLKSDNQTLLPEAKNLDYLWLIQSSSTAALAGTITECLKRLPEVQMAQVLEMDKLKSLSNLII